MKVFVDGPNSLDRNKEAEMCGRISGDVAWRSQRNELGKGIAKQRALEESTTSSTALKKPTAIVSKITNQDVKKISVRAGGLIDCIIFYVSRACVSKPFIDFNAPAAVLVNFSSIVSIGGC